MLANGADPNAFSRMNETALSWAIRRGSMAVVKRLMHLTDLSRGDLLHCVVERETSPDTTELIASLVQQGVPVASYQWDNEVAGVFRYGALAGSALHLACTMGNMTAVRALLLHGADPQQPGKRIRTGPLDPSYTPLQIAESKSNVPLRTLLLERGTK
jgi:ankyrin repeat protein